MFLAQYSLVAFALKKGLHMMHLAIKRTLRSLKLRKNTKISYVYFYFFTYLIHKLVDKIINSAIYFKLGKIIIALMIWTPSTCDETHNITDSDCLLMLVWEGILIRCLCQARTSVFEDVTNSCGRLFDKSMIERHENSDKLE